VKKVIVIGLDGLEPKITQAMLAEGRLPNLARLREQGGYSEVRTTTPAQTPVAWSTFTTGTNPGGHGIFDFLSRDPKTYLPVLALSRYEQKNAFVPPRVVNLRRGVPFWELLSKAGLSSTVLRCPCTYPPDAIQGRMLAGVGVPDLRGSLGVGTFYTTAAGVQPGMGEKVVQVQPDPTGAISTYLIGPRNPKTRDDMTCGMTLKLDPPGHTLSLRLEGATETLKLQEGTWSQWLKVKFKAGLLVSVHGMLRFYLRQTAPVFELYASPVNFDPAAPLYPISHPPEYAGELETRLGAYYTTGMAEDHDGLINGRFDDEAFLEQCQLVMQERLAMLRYELQRFKEGFLFCLFDTPDRLQHMFWRYRQPDHPANQLSPLQPGLDPLGEHYQACDAVVGKALQHADDQTLFIVLSDHGMAGFQRGLNLNTWLCENSYLALKPGCQPGPENGDFFKNVDWDKTRAYSLGLGGIFLNLKGRESRGIVDPAEAARVKASIIKGLSGLGDPERDQVAVRSVVDSNQIYFGPYVSEAPDLFVNFADGYRVSWGTPLGGAPAGLFEDNTKKWSGDHVIDPTLVPGVLFMNRDFDSQSPGLEDLAPTILAALGVPKIPAMHGRSLLL
jgi:predicted AlkP superfamily phosphohydrolase/phosphomutase